MKKLLFLCVLSAAFLAQAAPPLKLPFTIEPRTPRKIGIGKKAVITLTPDNFDIVQTSNPTVKFAAREMAEALSGVFGVTLKPVNAPGKKAFHIRLGDQALAAKLGIDPKKIDRDGFVIRTSGKDILIIGNDHPKNDPYRHAYGYGDRAYEKCAKSLMEAMQRAEILPNS